MAMFETMFSAAGMVAMAGWVGLLLLPHWRGASQFLATVLAPAILATGYLVMIMVWLSGTTGGFGSLAEVQALFGSPPVLLAGWVHYLAFDLLVGAWIARSARRDGIAHLVVVPLLLLTFLFGPIGWLAFHALQATRRLARGRPLISRLGRIWTAVIAREPTLIATAVLFALMTVPTTLAMAIDGRRSVTGANIWDKPLRFELALAIYLATLAWFVPMAGPGFRARRSGRFVVWGAILPALLEITYVVWRASRGEESHYNVAGSGMILWPLMGVGAVTLAAAAPVLGRAIARAPAGDVAPAYRWAVVLGLVLTFVLGALEGGLMSSMPGHIVGISPPGDRGIALFGWSRTAGDLRTAHFLGIHAQQALPLFGALATMMLPVRARAAVIGFAGCYILVTGAALVEALLGLPLLPAG